MAKKSKLIDLDIFEISLVDKGANQKEFIFKRDTGKPVKTITVNNSVTHAEFEKEGNAMDDCQRIIDSIRLKRDAMYMAKSILESGDATADQLDTAAKLLDAANRIIIKVEHLTPEIKHRVAVVDAVDKARNLLKLQPTAANAERLAALLVQAKS